MITPNVTLLRERIANAKNRKLDKQRDASKEFIARFNSHLIRLIADPDNFASHTSYSEEIKGDMYTSGSNSDFFFQCVKGELEPLGFRVEKSHDGGGMYSTIVVRWDIEKSKRKFGDVGPPYRRNDVDFPPCTGTNIYAPGTK